MSSFKICRLECLHHEDGRKGPLLNLKSKNLDEFLKTRSALSLSKKAKQTDTNFSGGIFWKEHVMQSTFLRSL